MDAYDDTSDTEVAPTLLAPPTQLAWSSEPVVYPRRRSWPAAYVAVAALVVCVLLLAGVLVIVALIMRPQPTASAPSTVLTQAVPAASMPPPVTYTSTVQAAPTTITVEAPPAETTTVRAAPPSPKPAAAPLSESVYDQRFLASMRSLGYRVTNEQLALSYAHETCQLFRLGETPDEVNRQIAAKSGANMTDVLQLTSSAMLSYPNCA
jgi:hypothetical protein